MSNISKKYAGVRRYHSVTRIATELDISKGMVHKLIAENLLQAKRFRRMVRVTDESYRKFLASLEPKTAA